MPLRITFDDSAGPPTTRPPERVPRPPTGRSTSFFDPDGSESGVSPMLLFVADEPEVGMRFTYTDIDWEVVDYRDGWIARLVVD